MMILNNVNILRAYGLIKHYRRAQFVYFCGIQFLSPQTQRVTFAVHDICIPTATANVQAIWFVLRLHFMCAQIPILMISKCYKLSHVAHHHNNSIPQLLMSFWVCVANGGNWHKQDSTHILSIVLLWAICSILWAVGHRSASYRCHSAS